MMPWLSQETRESGSSQEQGRAAGRTGSGWHRTPGPGRAHLQGQLTPGAVLLCEQLVAGGLFRIYQPMTHMPARHCSPTTGSSHRVGFHGAHTHAQTSAWCMYVWAHTYTRAHICLVHLCVQARAHTHTCMFSQGRQWWGPVLSGLLASHLARTQQAPTGYWPQRQRGGARWLGLQGAAGGCRGARVFPWPLMPSLSQARCGVNATI